MVRMAASATSIPRHSPEMDAAFQKYLLLSGQQDSLRRRLSTTPSRPIPTSRMNSHNGVPASYFLSSSASSPTSTSGTSSPHSPTSAYPLPPAAFGPEQFAPAHTSAIVSADPDDATSDNVLYDINQAIKATLTELLNRDAVKRDEQLRAWVQGRLMDTQLELRRQRRRRSSASDCGSAWFGSVGADGGGSSIPRSAGGAGD